MAAGVRSNRDAHRLKPAVFRTIMKMAGRKTPAPPKTNPTNTRSNKRKKRTDRARCRMSSANDTKEKIHRRILRFTTLNNEIIIS